MATGVAGEAGTGSLCEGSQKQEKGGEIAPFPFVCLCYALPKRQERLGANSATPSNHDIVMVRLDADSVGWFPP